MNKENKADALYNLRQIEQLLQKTIFLVEDEKQLDQIERNLYQVKKQLVNIIFDIEEVKI